jgi:hypothetical protein
MMPCRQALLPALSPGLAREPLLECSQPLQSGSRQRALLDRAKRGLELLSRRHADQDCAHRRMPQKSFDAALARQNAQCKGQAQMRASPGLCEAPFQPTIILPLGLLRGGAVYTRRRSRSPDNRTTNVSATFL